MIKYTEQAQKALNYAKSISRKLEHNYVGSEHLLLGLRHEYEGVAGQILSECGITEDAILKIMFERTAPGFQVEPENRDGLSPRLQAILEDAYIYAEACNSPEVGTEHLLLSMIRDIDCVGSRLIATLKVPLQKIYMMIVQVIGQEPDDSILMKGADVGTAQNIENYSTDLTMMARQGKLDPVIGREDEIKRVIQTLSRRNKNNPCLIGEPGVGKSAIVEGLAQKIAAGDVPRQLQNRRILTLDLSGMVAGSKYRGEFEERIKGLIKEVQQDENIILFMDEVHTLIGAGSAEGTMDAANILKPALARGTLRLIGATTITEYRKYIEKDAALERRFQPVMVEEPDVKTSIEILKGIRGVYEDFHRVEITDSALEEAVRLSERYITDRNLPDKAIDVLDEACALVSLKTGKPEKAKNDPTKYDDRLMQLDQFRENAIFNGNMEAAAEFTRAYDKLLKSRERLEKKLEASDKSSENNSEVVRTGCVDDEVIAQVVSKWTRIPLNKLQEKESRRLLNLEKELHRRVIGQDEAVKAVAKAVKRGRVGLKDPGRPVGSFLFLGPTGVGKTELSKALAQALFQSETSLIRVDMSEYMESHSVSKMIGSPPGYVGHEDGGQLSDQVRSNPYSVILFDEIEKAHPDVFNILLQVLDDGRITDSKGRVVDFKNTVIIMTSNAGAKEIVEPKKLGFASAEDRTRDYENMKSNVMNEVRRIFKPEFLNRLDEIIVFHELSGEELSKIADLLIRNLTARASEQMGIRLTVRKAVKDHIIQTGTDRKYGARPLKRAIQNQLEDTLADAVLEGEVKEGDEIILSVKDGKVVYQQKKK